MLTQLVDVRLLFCLIVLVGFTFVIIRGAIKLRAAGREQERWLAGEDRIRQLVREQPIGIGKTRSTGPYRDGQYTVYAGTLLVNVLSAQMLTVQETFVATVTVLDAGLSTELSDFGELEVDGVRYSIDLTETTRA